MFIAKGRSVSNYEAVDESEQLQALLALRWSDRRIAREVGVNRKTVGKRRAAIASRPAEAFAGSAGGNGTAAGARGQAGTSKADEASAARFAGNKHRPQSQQGLPHLGAGGGMKSERCMKPSAHATCARGWPPRCASCTRSGLCRLPSSLAEVLTQRLEDGG